MTANAAAWRAWSEAASPELREDFDRRTLAALREVRHGFPPDCGPHHPHYHELRADSVRALDELALTIQEEHDHAEH